jgi:tartrate dehydrogenase/decarboxylase/D-malate dehydrogenase
MTAIERVTADRRLHTPDLGGTARTADVTAGVIEAINASNT